LTGGPERISGRSIQYYTPYGDLGYFKSQEYDSASATYTTMSLDTSDYVYAANGDVISFTRFAWNQDTGEKTPEERYTVIQRVVSTLPREQTALLLAPNPATTTTRLQTKPGQNVELLSSTGQTLRTFYADNAGTADLDVTGLPKGIYVVRGIGTHIQQRLIVE
jgi:hypothetical protein